jgi:non-canonical purine NTP pyrophosphatase (RdgB/HAM1 family)
VKSDIIFITGNPNKAEYLSRNLGIEIAHQKLDLPELQSLDTEEIVTAKAKSAYEQIGSPVLVEDVSLVFHALGRLPGPFIKWFESELNMEQLCRLVDPFDDRSATARVTYCLYGGAGPQLFPGEMHGYLADHPRGTRGWGFDVIFIHEGMDRTRAELSQEEYDRLSYRHQPIAELRRFLD